MYCTILNLPNFKLRLFLNWRYLPLSIMFLLTFIVSVQKSSNYLSSASMYLFHTASFISFTFFHFSIHILYVVFSFSISFLCKFLNTNLCILSLSHSLSFTCSPFALTVFFFSASFRASYLFIVSSPIYMG